jgi:hypothetical protein
MFLADGSKDRFAAPNPENRMSTMVAWEHSPYPFRHASLAPSQFGECGLYEVVVRRARTVAIVVRAIANDRSGEAERAVWPR